MIWNVTSPENGNDREGNSFRNKRAKLELTIWWQVLSSLRRIYETNPARHPVWEEVKARVLC